MMENDKRRATAEFFLSALSAHDARRLVHDLYGQQAARSLPSGTVSDEQLADEAAATCLRHGGLGQLIAVLLEMRPKREFEISELGRTLGVVEVVEPTRPTIDGYEELELVGSGSTARVYRGRHVLLGETHAIKVLSVKSAEDMEAWDRFVREARAIRSLEGNDNIGIVTVYGIERKENIGYITMEYAPEGSLEDRILAGTEFSELELVQIGLRAAHALETAHARGVIHRDTAQPGLVDRARRRA